MRKYIILFSLLQAFSVSYSQKIVDDSSVNVKWGMAISANTGFGVGVGAELNLYKETQVYSLSFSRAEELVLIKTAQYSNQIDLLYGGYKYSDNKSFKIVYQAGIGVVRGIKRGQYLYSSGDLFFGKDYYEELPYITLGVPLKIGMIYLPEGNFFSVGFDFHANINNKNPSFMPLISCKFGIK